MFAVAVVHQRRLLRRKYAGTDVKIEGEEYLIMREDDVLGVIE